MVRGSYHFKLNGFEDRLRPGEILIVKPGDWHADFCNPPLHYVCIAFHLTPDTPGNQPPLLFADTVTAGQQRITAAHQTLWPILQKLQDELSRKAPFAAHLQEALLLEFFWKLVRALPVEILSPRFRPWISRDTAPWNTKATNRIRCRRFNSVPRISAPHWEPVHMNSPIRVALVGCGWISGAHIDGFRELYGRGCREILFTACCDSNEDNAQRQAAELAGIQGQAPAIFKSIDALLQAKAADVAVACLPHYLHHTLVEQLLASNVQVIRHEPFDYHNPAFKWRGVKMLTGGGLLLDSGAHFADMQLLAFGDPESVYCMLGTHDQQIIPDAPVVGTTQPDIEDTWHAVIRYKHGGYGLLRIGNAR